MPLKPESRYPSRRTYVLKVRSEADRTALAGRVENVVTERWHEFASGHELIDSIASDIEASGGEPPADANGN